MDDTNRITKQVGTYYQEKILSYGATPQGVDWNGEVGQILRFSQICKIIDFTKKFTILDLGCGYGALVDYLKLNKANFEYVGFDISEGMIEEAKKRYFSESCARFTTDLDLNKNFDYVVSSGVFNVCLHNEKNDWERYVISILDIMNNKARNSFSFNCLTSYSDRDKTKDYLYYGNPTYWFDYCKKKYSRHISLLHDYGLYEFTILVKKDIKLS